MALPSQTPSGRAIPPASRHSITVHLPLWSNLVRWIDGDNEIISSIKSMYPRMMLHKDVRDLNTEVWRVAGSPAGQSCLLFSDLDSALACKAFATRNTQDLSSAEVTIKSLRISDVYLSAVFFPDSERSSVQPFWTHTGTGISSRLAEHCLENLTSISEVGSAPVRREVPERPLHETLRQRIAGLLQREVDGPLPNVPVSCQDVYLFPTGMAAVYAAHRCISQPRNGIDALVGFPFKSTYYLLQNLGSGVRLLDSAACLELAIETAEKIPQVIWTEVPSNPLLTTADLIRIRTLADKHQIPLLIDDTIGSFCNIDVLGVADILITSLTKSFSGYADVMGGSLVLNPASHHYQKLKSTMNDIYINDYWSGDAEVLEKNSGDYLSRSSILNTTAERLVSYLKRYADDDRSTVAKLYYPTINADREYYDRMLRPRSEDFTPGYGCLFTIEFESLAATIAFYDNLSVYNGPHLGAHLTLAMAYVKGLYSQQLDWVAQYGLKETQIRISVGLEDFEKLRDRFDVALAAADLEKSNNS